MIYFPNERSFDFVVRKKEQEVTELFSQIYGQLQALAKNVQAHFGASVQRTRRNFAMRSRTQETDG